MVLLYMTVVLSIQLIASSGTVTATLGNVALGKPTGQISDLLGAVSSLAVDGVLEVVRPHCAHTLGNANAWWFVNLEERYYIAWVRIYNRVDCCPQRLSNFTISVGNDYNGDVKYTLCHYHDGEYGIIPLFLPCNCTEPAQYVKIQLMGGKGYLTLCEVEVYTTDYIFNDTSSVNDMSTTTSPTVIYDETTAVSIPSVTVSVDDTSGTGLLSQSMHGLTTSFSSETATYEMTSVFNSQPIYTMSTTQPTENIVTSEASTISVHKSMYTRLNTPLTERSTAIHERYNSESSSNTSVLSGTSQGSVDGDHSTLGTAVAVSDTIPTIMSDMSLTSLSDSIITRDVHHEPSSDVNWKSRDPELSDVSSDTQMNDLMTAEMSDLMHASSDTNTWNPSDINPTSMLEYSSEPSDSVIHNSRKSYSQKFTQSHWPSETGLIQSTKVIDTVFSADVTTGVTTDVTQHGSQASVTSGISGVHSRQFLCTSMCPGCSVPVDISMAEDEARRLRSRLLLDRKDLSLYIRTKTSADNKVRSSVYIGWSGMVIIGVVAALVVIPDLALIVRDCVQKLNKNNP